MNATFLKQLSQQILSENTVLKDILVLLPGKRGVYILDHELHTNIESNTFAPLIYSIEDFILSLAGESKGDSLLMMFALYEEFKFNTKENADLTFEQFLTIGNVLLQDFSDIREHVDQEYYTEIFTYLNEFKKLALWNKDELTTFEKKYIESWHAMKSIFENMGKWMQKNQVYDKGFLMEMALQNFDENYVLKGIKKVYIAGFNAINYKEEKLFKLLENKFETQFVWDIDNYYFNNKHNEAGDFLRKNQKKFPMDKSKFSSSFESNKQIEVLASSGNVQQIEWVNTVLDDLIKNENTKDTVIVLNDEKLLQPLLHSFSEELIEGFEGINITMGLRVQSLFLFQFLMRLLKLEAHYFNQNKKQFYYKDIYYLLDSFSYFIDSKSKNNLTIFLDKHSQTYYTIDEIIIFSKENMIELHSLFLKFLENHKNVNQFIENSISLMELIENTKDLSLFEYSTAQFLYKELQQLKQFFDQFHEHKTFSLLQWIFERNVAKKSIALDGDSTKGLQIMGMLETRNLDFANVIMLNVNEGILPSGKIPSSSIPFEARAMYGIPDHYQQDAVFAYHFIRILQRADNVFLAYNSLKDENQNGEKSRFITQLEMELPETVSFKEIVHSPKIQIQNNQEIFIEKNENVNNQINQYFKRLSEKKFLSYTAMNDLILCPLKFYWKNVLGIKQIESPMEESEVSNIGSILHAVLEEFYIPLLNKDLVEKDFIIEDNELRAMIQQQFAKELPNVDIEKGKNVIDFEKIFWNIKNVLKTDRERCKKSLESHSNFKILSLEKTVMVPMNFSNGLMITLGGIIDRIEMENQEIFICDYKSSKKDKGKLYLRDYNDLKLNSRNYARQLLHYLLIFKNDELAENKTLNAGIYFVKNLKEGLVQLSFKNKELNYLENVEDYLNAYQEEIEKSILQFHDTETKICQTQDSDTCNYCDFNTICNIN